MSSDKPLSCISNTSSFDERHAILAGFIDRNAEAIAAGTPDSDERMTWKGEQWPPLAPAGVRAAWALDILAQHPQATPDLIAALEARIGHSRADGAAYGKASRDRVDYLVRGGPALSSSAAAKHGASLPAVTVTAPPEPDPVVELERAIDYVKRQAPPKVSYRDAFPIDPDSVNYGAFLPNGYRPDARRGREIETARSTDKACELYLGCVDDPRFGARPRLEIERNRDALAGRAGFRSDSDAEADALGVLMGVRDDWTSQTGRSAISHHGFGSAFSSVLKRGAVAIHRLVSSADIQAPPRLWLLAYDYAGSVIGTSRGSVDITPDRVLDLGGIGAVVSAVRAYSAALDTITMAHALGEATPEFVDAVLAFASADVRTAWFPVWCGDEGDDAEAAQRRSCAGRGWNFYGAFKREAEEYIRASIA